MKNYILLTFFVILLSSNFLDAQEPLTYEKVIQAEGMSKDKIYDAVKAFAVDFYDANTRKFDLEDRTAGMIRISGFYNYKTHSFACFNGDIFYVLKIEVREERYKVSFGEFNHNSGCGLWEIDDRPVYQNKGLEKKMNNKEWPFVQQSTADFSNTFFAAIKNATDKASTDNDW